jgi:uncharacterized protein
VNLKPIIHSILEDYALPWDGIHGVSHWARVLENGLRLAQVTDANIAVVELFAIFHDSCRVNEAVDPGHGQRGADLAAELRGDLFKLPDADFRLLYDACVGHTDGETNADITIQSCWDADRLDLGRVGMTPDPKKLCTPAAKRPETLKWADSRGAFRTIPEIISGEWGIDTRGWDRTVR